MQTAISNTGVLKGSLTGLPITRTALSTKPFITSETCVVTDNYITTAEPVDSIINYGCVRLAKDGASYEVLAKPAVLEDGTRSDVLFWLDVASDYEAELFVGQTVQIQYVSKFTMEYLRGF